MGQGLEENEMTPRRKVLAGSVPGVLVFAYCLAQEVPLKNWIAPPYSANGVAKAVDATDPRAFIGLQPCRILDTRGNGAPIAGGIFANSEARNYTVAGICGLPTSVDAVSVNFTVTGSPAAPPGAFLLAWPQGRPAPPVSILNFQAGQTVANAAIVPLLGGRMTVNVSHGTHVIMDVNGYFSQIPANENDSFRLLVNSPLSPAMIISNGAPDCANLACGLSVHTLSNLEAQAIEGSYSGGGNGQGVYGNSYGQGPEAAGVFGTGRRIGVMGQISFDVANTSAVRGDHRSTGSQGIGVWGSHAGTGWGVYGTTVGAGRGVYGQVTGAGTGVRGRAGAGGVGVFFEGGLAGTGTKSFIEPHPTDPALAIKYVSLEGPEAGTYFRGRGKFERGIATIAVPETFRMVTAEEGLSIQVMPIGEMATSAVVRIDLREIVIKASRNVEFFYTVNGVRRAYDQWDPLVSSEMAFRPETPDARIPDNLSEDERARLIANGTYTKDGKVNLETARRLGWDQAWKVDAPGGTKPAH